MSYTSADSVVFVNGKPLAFCAHTIIGVANAPAHKEAREYIIRQARVTLGIPSNVEVTAEESLYLPFEVTDSVRDLAIHNLTWEYHPELAAQAWMRLALK